MESATENNNFTLFNSLNGAPNCNESENWGKSNGENVR